MAQPDTDPTTVARTRAIMLEVGLVAVLEAAEITWPGISIAVAEDAAAVPLTEAEQALVAAHQRSA